MRLLTLKTAWHDETDTFCGWFIHVPGRLIRTSKCCFLKLPENIFGNRNEKKYFSVFTN